ncbi:MAG: hypothetical protein ABI460_13710 [Caldimonas sp.]
MNARQVISGSVLLLLLVGCGTTAPIAVKCEDAVCPVVIESRFLRGYAAVPDDIYPVPPTSRIVVWRFAAGDGSFTMLTSPPDGILVDGAPDPAAVGITDCRPSGDDQGSSEVASGGYYRCRVRGKAAAFTVTYKLKLHDRYGIQRTLDPYVTNSGGPGGGTGSKSVPVLTKGVAGPIVRIALSASAATPEPATITPPAIGEDATIVVWMAPSGSQFDTDPLGSAADGVAFDKAIGTNRPPCRATSDADGTLEVEVGQYFRCTLWKNVTITPTKYTAQFRTGNSISQVTGSLQ